MADQIAWVDYLIAVFAKLIETGQPQWRFIHNVHGTIDVFYFGMYLGRYDPGTTAG